MASFLTKRPILLQFGAGLTPLMVGVAYGDKELARTFSAHFRGQETDRGVTALMLGVLYDNMEFQELLSEESGCLKQQTL